MRTQRAKSGARLTSSTHPDVATRRTRRRPSYSPRHHRRIAHHISCRCHPSGHCRCHSLVTWNVRAPGELAGRYRHHVHAAPRDGSSKRDGRDQNPSHGSTVALDGGVLDDTHDRGRSPGHASEPAAIRKGRPGATTSTPSRTKPSRTCDASWLPAPEDGTPRTASRPLRGYSSGHAGARRRGAADQ